MENSAGIVSLNRRGAEQGTVSNLDDRVYLKLNKKNKKKLGNSLNPLKYLCMSLFIYLFITYFNCFPLSLTQREKMSTVPVLGHNCNCHCNMF